MFLESVCLVGVSLNKFLILPLVFSIIVSSDDLKIAEDFKEGDIVSAETFNQIFSTLEKINREVRDSDILGVWECSSLESGNEPVYTSGWEKKGFLYLLNSSQLNFTEATGGTSLSSSLNTPYTFSTSAPSPIYVGDSSSSGSYTLYKERIYFNFSDDPRLIGSYDINLISKDRFTLSASGGSAGEVDQTHLVDFIFCDRKNAVPAAPTLPSAVNNKATITLAWTDVSVDETGFKIYRKIDGSSEYTLISTQTETSYSDSDTSEGTKYFYYIVSYNDNGDSAKSLIISATADTIAPTAIASSPANNETVGRQLYEIIVEFSEKVEIVCPAGDQYGGMPDTCPTSGGAITFTANIEGSSRTPSLRYPTLGTGGSKTLRLGTMGSAERFDANQNNIEVTINKDWIRDANGNQMTSDFSFSFNVDATLQNPGCPPSC